MKKISPFLPLAFLAGYLMTFAFGSTWMPAYDIPVITLALIAIPVIWYANRG